MAIEKLPRTNPNTKLLKRVLSIRKREMAAGKEGVPNPDFDLDPPLDFRCPSWFRDYYDGMERFPGEVCWYHEDICKVVARDMCILRRQSQPQTAEEVEREEEEMRKEEERKDEKRQKRINEIWEEKQTREEEKQTKEEEKRRDKRMRLMEQEWMQKEVKEECAEEKLASLDISLTDNNNSTASLDISLTDNNSSRVWTIVEMGESYDLSLLLSGGRRTNGTHLITNKGTQVL